MKTFIINLEEEVERKEKITNQCKQHDIDYHLIKAVNGKKLPQEVISAVTADYPACGLTLGEIGCALSHLTIYAKIINENLNCALILEDDATFKTDLHAYLSKIEASISNSKPEIYILTAADTYNKSITRRFSKQLTFYRLVYGSCAHGYVINKTAALALRKYNLPVRFEADRWTIFRDLGGIHIWCLDKEIISTTDPDKNNSALEKERTERSLLRRKVINKLKRETKWYQLKRIKNVLINKISGKKIVHRAG
ncbi:glycosyltransferase family 25 protein [Mixta intestinalis]|uniref:Lipooligosaccharide biosynthesis protein lex-1 n=1 Tax=Mixta intestinalis TaxID=1615494 RepID=A0A6P1PXG9_9GAMM|nr:glycosyltransferase family 25 protein [Mixta intestinalis]QHM71260.1 Lipooligosaccharide biosynthesis protein lex-1 [Mixta intestinalis]